MKPRILITGSNGQVGHYTTKILNNYTIIPTTRDMLNLDSKNNITSVINDVRPNIIINTAAYTDVNKAESEIEIAQSINAIAPGIIAEEAKKINAVLIHFSTDYVFDGYKHGKYRENDLTAPLNAYGKTKLLGEKNIIMMHNKYIILRTSWVYSNIGKNFLKTMLMLGREKEKLEIIDDQVGTPTSALFLAKIIKQIIPLLIKNKDFNYGIYHATCNGSTTWYGFAKEIFRLANIKKIPLKINNLVPILSHEYITPAVRPQNSQLNCKKLQNIIPINWNHWRADLKELFYKNY